MVKHSPAPWKLYSEKLRPKFPTPILEIQDKNGEALVAWSGFDGVNQSPARKLANARLIAKAWLIPELVVVLGEAEEYFDQRADAEYLPGQAAPIGNEEMRLLTEIRALLAKTKEPSDG